MSFKFKVGDKVRFEDMVGIVVSLSIGWTPELYRVEFKDGDRMWVSRDNLTLYITREKVIFT